MNNAFLDRVPATGNGAGRLSVDRAIAGGC